MSANRPPGHVTALIRELQRWSRNRDAKQLDTELLTRATIYLDEYRALLAQERRRAD